MYSNFIKTAIRFLWRHKTYTILNYLCLTFGLTCFIVASLNVTRVINYDRFHTNYNRLFEVEANVTYFNGDQFPKELLSASLPEVIKKEVPEIESISRVVNCSYPIINGENSFSENGIYADPDFLESFTFPLIAKQGTDPFINNNSIVISERLALKLFNTTDCIGKSVILKKDSGMDAHTISGIMINVPNQSYLQFNFILPFSKYLSVNSWALDPGATSNQIWALLSANSDLEKTNEKLKNLIKNQEPTLNQELFLFPLSEKMLYYYVGGRRVWREMQNIVLIVCIGFAILLIACFNFINLSIALNIRRYREVGIKKILGAQRPLIILQHMAETSIIIFFSFLTSLDLMKLSVNALNRTFNGDVQFDLSDFRVILILAAILLFTLIASGLLPAMYLSSSRPVNILKGKIVTDSSFSFLRQSLIVFQFTIPIVLIIFVFIVRKQDLYLRNFDLGFTKENIMIVNTSGELEVHSESIRTDLGTIPGIEYVSFSNCIPARGARLTNEVSWEGKNVTEKLHFWCINTDDNYDKIVNLKVSEGRFFDKSYPADSSCYLVNDVAVRTMNYDNPVGKTITLEGKKGTIIGIFKDFHAIGLAGPFTPTIISLTKRERSNILIKITKGSFHEVSSRVKEVLTKYEPEKTYQPYLYSDLVRRTELTSVSYLLSLAFFISILLASMGLSGLTSFTAASRTKEIGIRKINGASVFSVMRLLGLSYSKWLLISTVISFPAAYLLGTVFLARFNFRISMPYGLFILGPVLAYIIAMASISLQSLKAATRNPVDALRYE